MKKFISIILAAGMVLSMTACGGNDAQTKAPETNAADTQKPVETEAAETAGETAAGGAAATDLGYDKLVIGVDDTFAPMGFRDETNELVGFDIEMAQAVGDKLGVEVEFQVINWDMKEQELIQGNVDLIWNGYTITEARKEQVAFTDPYLDNKQVVVTMADSGITSLADLTDKVVAAQINSSAVDAMDAMPEVSDTFADRPTFDTNDMAILDMEAGRADAVVADSVLLEYVVSHKEDPSKYVILEEDFGSEEYGIGVRKEDTVLLDAINNAIDELKADGTAAEISTKWFGSDIVK